MANMWIALYLLGLCLPVVRCVATQPYTLNVKMFSCRKAGPNITTVEVTSVEQPASITPGEWYIIGEGPNVVHVWQPYNGPSDNYIGGETWVFLASAANFVETTRVAGQDTVTLNISSVGWDGVGNTPICKGQLPCPDVVWIGTTQVASRVSEGVLAPLDDHFSDFAAQYGLLPFDDFAKGTIRDYYILDRWFAMPYLADTRVLVFNVTTFTDLGLTFPPPLGDWGTDAYGTNWTWGKLAEYAKIINDSGRGYGWQFKGGWNEELFLTSAIARNYGGQWVQPNMTCGVNKPSFKTAIREVFEKMYVTDKSADPDFTFNGDASVIDKYRQDPLPDPLDYPIVPFCCNRLKWTTLPGMTFVGPVAGGEFFVEGQSQYHNDDPTSKIAMAYPPGRTTFLGGSGLAITSKARNPKLAFQLLLHFTSTLKPYIYDLNSAFSAAPPYDSALTSSLISQKNSVQLVGQMMKHAVPAQYPLSGFREFGDMELRKPFRLLLAEMIYKNVSIDNATDRACTMVNYLLRPACQNSDYTFEVSSCDPKTLTRTAMAKWKVPKLCNDALAGSAALESNITGIECTYMPIKSVRSVGLMVAGAIAMTVSAILAASMFWFRDRPPVRKSGYLYSQLIIFGSIVAYGFVFLSLGEPTVVGCKARVWMLVLGFALMFAPLTLKIWRVVLIFANTKAQPLKLSDWNLLQRLAIIIMVEVGALIFWSFYENPGVSSRQNTLIPNMPYTYSSMECSDGATAGSMILIGINVALILWSVYYSWLSRDAPSAYGEAKFVAIAIYSITFALVIIFPVSTIVNTNSIRVILQSGALVFIGVTSMLVFVVPKLRQADLGVAERSKPSYSSVNSATLSAKGKSENASSTARFSPSTKSSAAIVSP